MSSISLPRKVVYIDQINSWWPDVTIDVQNASFAGFNVIILAFYLTSGPTDVAGAWASATSLQRKNALQYIHNNGGIVLVSAGGATDVPYSMNPITYATSVATWAKENGLDGVDYDFEHFDKGMTYGNMTSCDMLQWIGQCIITTKQIMGTNSILTSAPQPPYFEPAWVGQVPTGCSLSSNTKETGGYFYIEKYFGNLIDWYNVQYYNNGSQLACFTSYQGLFIDSGKAGCIDFPDLAVLQINNYGIPLQKIVVGKPMLLSDANSISYVTPEQLNQWVIQAKNNLGWNAGIMTWQWHDLESGIQWINTIYPGSFNPNIPAPLPTPQSSNDSNDTNDSLPDWVWVVVAFMIVFFIAMVVLASLYGIEKNK